MASLTPTIPERGLATSLTKDKTVPRTYVCRVTSKDQGEGTEFTLGARPVVVGGDPECDVVLEDKKVSRRHMELHARPDGLHVKDLGSTNGTFVDNVRVSDAVVAVGVSIRCGNSHVTVAAAPAPTVSASRRDRFGGLVGESFSSRELFAVLELASPTNATVLIQGESGTGKELAARAIHDHSDRAGGPFVVVDFGGSSEQLIESQLFGHVRGAFTGAVNDRNGAFVEAHGGTLFLDEIGELPLPLQARLLRALEARTIQPLGADRPVQVDVRVVAATHRDLHAMVQNETFRFDLFYRLAVVHALIPPLRARREDLPPLIRYLYEQRGQDPGPIEGPNLELLQNYTWPGNVRELRNILDRAHVLSGAEDTPFTELKIWLQPGSVAPFEVVDTTLPFKQAKERWVSGFERRYLASLYERHHQNVSRAAAQAGLSRTHFRELLQSHGIRGKTIKDS